MKKSIFQIALLLVVSFSVTSSAQALTISPARLELSGDPGQTISGEFTLTNEQEDGKTFYSSAENFEAQGESGTPTFTNNKDGLASWVKVTPEVTLAKGAKQKISFTITIPQDADAGGHFAAIFLSTVPNSTDQGQVSIGAKIGVLVLLRVSGDIKEGGGITTFTTKDKGRVFTSLPVNFVYHFNNSGNDRVNPTGDLIISNIIGFETAQLAANQTQGNVLPGSTRRFDVIWGDSSPGKSGFFYMAGYQLKHFAFGLYTADVTLTYGDKGTASASKIIFIFPWQLIVVALIILALIFFIFTRLLKRYNQWIIKKARNV